MNTNPRYSRGTLQSLGFFALLAAILAVMFWESFLPGVVHFSNDGPLGVQSADVLDLPEGFTGMWFDLNSIGFASGAFSLNVTTLLKWLLGPVGYSKFLPPIALFFLGCGAWTLFRQLRFSPLACTLGGIASALCSTFFSTASWGVASQQIAMGMNFIAVALVIASVRTPRLFRQVVLLILAGAAVGLSIMEGLDNGALFSICIAAFTVCWSIVHSQSGWVTGLLAGVGRTAVIAICSAIVAAQTLAALITTQIQGVAGMGQDQQTREQKWDWATQWSLPKKEVLSFFVPGVFGFRMDTPDGGNYWGAIGRDPAWDRYFASDRSGPTPVGSMRFSGGGIYLGVPVALIACWAAWQSMRRKDSIFPQNERRILWFWIAVAIISLLLAFGRFAPFYQFLYALPYFSTIRNPVKFTAIFNFATLVLFAYGINALWHRFIAQPGPHSVPRTPGDRRWITGMFVALATAVIACIFYSASRQNVLEYMQRVQAEPAELIARFSLRQVIWFLILLAGSVIVLTMILKGKFTGGRARTAGIVLGALIVIDLGIANLPWTVFVDYKHKYASNPVIEFLREKPYEQRVAILPFRSPPELSLFEQLYRIEWAQHHFPYYNIQSLDVVQMPRVAQDLAAFETALHYNGDQESIHLIPRRWALTSTRYLLGATGFRDVLNDQLGGGGQTFRIIASFDLVPKPGISQPRQLEDLSAAISTNGRFALFEYTAALPRASLHANWLIPAKSELPEPLRTPLPPEKLSQLQGLGTNDLLTLQILAAPRFNPSELVLLADNASLPPQSSGVATNAGTVDYTHYSPKNIRLEANATEPSILLLNDKYDPTWQVFVDGKPAELLRCNFIMRGVYLPAGNHEVEFIYRTDLRPLYVTFGAMLICVLLAGYVAISGRQNRD